MKEERRRFRFKFARKRFSRNSGPRFEPPARLFYTPPRSHCNLAYRIPSAARTHRRSRSFPSPSRLKPARGEGFDPTGERGTTFVAGAARQPSLRWRAIPHLRADSVMARPGNIAGIPASRTVRTGSNPPSSVGEGAVFPSSGKTDLIGRDRPSLIASARSAMVRHACLLSVSDHRFVVQGRPEILS